MRIQSLLVVHKRTAYEMFVEEERNPRMLQLLAESHFTVQDLVKSHQEHRETMDCVGRALDELKVPHRFVRRGDLRDTAAHDLVVTLGGDGTFLDASHYLRDKAILGVNSSPSHSVGLFCGATSKTFKTVLAAVLAGKSKPTLVNRVGLVLNGNPIVEPVLNEALVCAQNPAMTARYVIEVGKKKEHQKSSGVYVGPAAGSTASIRAAGGAVLPIASKKVQFVVREAYRGRGSKYSLLKGIVPPKSGMRFHSKMPTGMVFIDGAHVRYRFDFGDELQVNPEYVPLTVYGLPGKR